MNDLKDAMLALIGAQAKAEAAALAGELARAAEGDKESVLAALEFEQWLAQSCRECRRRV
jgi:hypothetical protein